MGGLTDFFSGVCLTVIGITGAYFFGLYKLDYDKSKALPPPQTIVGTILEEQHMKLFGPDQYLLTISAIDGSRKVITFDEIITPKDLPYLEASLVPGDQVTVTFSPYPNEGCEPERYYPCDPTLYGLDAVLLDGN